MIDKFSGKYRFLSNPYETPIYFEGITYRSTEYAFQAAKSIQHEMRKKIASAPTWQAAKELGRKIELRSNWDVYWRYSTMEILLSIKFSSAELGNMLLATKTHGLIEGNTWHDQIWGDCRCGASKCLPTGMNLLGWMLVRQRDKLTGR